MDQSIDDLRLKSVVNGVRYGDIYMIKIYLSHNVITPQYFYDIFKSEILRKAIHYFSNFITDDFLAEQVFSDDNVYEIITSYILCEINDTINVYGSLKTPNNIDTAWKKIFSKLFQVVRDNPEYVCNLTSIEAFEIVGCYYEYAYDEKEDFDKGINIYLDKVISDLSFLNKRSDLGDWFNFDEDIKFKKVNIHDICKTMNIIPYDHYLQIVTLVSNDDILWSLLFYYLISEKESFGDRIKYLWENMLYDMSKNTSNIYSYLEDLIKKIDRYSGTFKTKYCFSLLQLICKRGINDRDTKDPIFDFLIDYFKHILNKNPRKFSLINFLYNINDRPSFSSDSGNINAYVEYINSVMIYDRNIFNTNDFMRLVSSPDNNIDLGRYFPLLEDKLKYDLHVHFGINILRKEPNKNIKKIPNKICKNKSMSELFMKVFRYSEYELKPGQSEEFINYLIKTDFE